MRCKTCGQKLSKQADVVDRSLDPDWQSVKRTWLGDEVDADAPAGLGADGEPLNFSPRELAPECPACQQPLDMARLERNIKTQERTAERDLSKQRSAVKRAGEAEARRAARQDRSAARAGGASIANAQSQPQLAPQLQPGAQPQFMAPPLPQTYPQAQPPMQYPVPPAMPVQYPAQAQPPMQVQFPAQPTPPMPVQYPAQPQPPMQVQYPVPAVRSGRAGRRRSSKYAVDPSRESPIMRAQEAWKSATNARRTSAPAGKKKQIIGTELDVDQSRWKAEQSWRRVLSEGQGAPQSLAERHAQDQAEDDRRRAGNYNGPPQQYPPGYPGGGAGSPHQ